MTTIRIVMCLPNFLSAAETKIIRFGVSIPGPLSVSPNMPATKQLCRLGKLSCLSEGADDGDKYLRVVMKIKWEHTHKTFCTMLRI